MRRVEPDRIDLQILKDLQDNGRITNVELARRAGELRVLAILRQRYLFLVPIAAVGLGTLGLALLLEQPALQRLYAEGQLIENATVAFYALAVILLLCWSKAGRRFRWLSAFAVLLCALRELDWHNAFTSESLLKLSYYVRDDDPIAVRILAGVVVLGILAVLLRYFTYARALKAAVGAGRPHGYSALAAILLLPLSKTFDSSPRMIQKHLDIDLAAGLRHVIHLTEESLELAIPLLIALSIAQFNWRAARERS